MIKCIICEKVLKGRQRKYCSTTCKNSYTNKRYQNYQTQQERGTTRRAELIKMKGGGCQQCGYNKNQAALSFHHRDPSLKELKIDIRSCSNRSWDILLKEIEKCNLYCSNCHMETHYPHLSL